MLSPFCVWGTGTPVEGSLMHSRSQGAKKVGGGVGDSVCVPVGAQREGSLMQSHAVSCTAKARGAKPQRRRLGIRDSARVGGHCTQLRWWRRAHGL